MNLEEILSYLKNDDYLKVFDNEFKILGRFQIEILLNYINELLKK